jgi:hypothetical protein
MWMASNGSKRRARRLSTTDGAAIALELRPDQSRLVDLLVELAELTSR